MQKAKAGWTSVTGKTGVNGVTAVAQKVAAGWTQVSGK
jgi:hypothetical protein